MNSKIKNIAGMRKDAEKIFYSGLRAVNPGLAVKRYCKLENNHLFVADLSYDLSEYKNIFVIGAGKATAPMAAEIENILGSRVTKGIINVKYGHTSKLARIKLIESGHPVPDKNGRQGAEAIIDLANNAGEDDLVLCLISGGGSALLPLPCPGITLKDKQDTIKILLSCGAAIHEINALRKHVSMIKGGRLAQAAHPASLVSLILSDVVGDNPDVIASGPTVPDSSSFDDCMKIIDRYNIREKLPKPVVKHIKEGISGMVPETPKAGDPVFEKAQNIIIGSNIEAISAAKKKSKSLGYNTIVLSSMIQGDTTHVAHVHSAIAGEIIKTGNPIPSPACILSGGETTVIVSGKGIGGRNQEFALAAAIDIAGAKNIVVLSGGTDGTDGPTDAAGAIADTNTLSRAMAMGLNPGYFLANNDSYHFFQKLGDLLITGPTNTNVMDLRIVLVAISTENGPEL
ncbi:MAG: glycerate kinase [Candidatus Desulfaltia sp.]|nr:glycerate kinase [Candidatus Desulfaltia sp.]